MLTHTVQGGENEGGASAEILAHEMGHANFHHSNPERTDVTSNRVACNNNDQGLNCCASAAGCGGALNEGLADVHSALLFPSTPNVGEFAVNSLLGLTAAGLTRDVRRNVELELSPSHVRSAFGGIYPIHYMGAVYASIWWAVYTQRQTDKTEIEVLFTEHLPLLSYQHTFADAAKVILNLDNLLLKGKYSSAFRREFEVRGITLQ